MEGRLRACCRHNRVNLAVNISSVHQINSQPCCVAMICPALRKHVTHLKPKILSQLCDRQFSFRDNDNITQHADPLHRGLLPAGKFFLFPIPHFIRDTSKKSPVRAATTLSTRQRLGILTLGTPAPSLHNNRSRRRVDTLAWIGCKAGRINSSEPTRTQQGRQLRIAAIRHTLTSPPVGVRIRDAILGFNVLQFMEHSSSDEPLLFRLFHEL